MNIYYFKNLMREFDFFKNDIFKKDLYDIEINFILLNNNCIINYDQNKHNIIVCNKAVKLEYIEDIILKLKPFVIFHLRDELGEDSKYYELYSKYNIKYLFHQYNCNKINYKIMHYQIPLGYISGFLVNKSLINKNIKNIKNQKYDFSFVGELKNDREEMLKQFSDNFENKFITIRKTNLLTSENKNIKSSELFNIYSNTLFVPIGRANKSLDCFRLYEIIVAGAIPVICGSIEETDITFKFNNIKPHIIIADTWEEAVLLCKKLYNNNDKIYNIINSNYRWFKEQIITISDKINKVIYEVSLPPMNKFERFEYYIKSWKHKETIQIPDDAKKFKQNELIYYSGPHTQPPGKFPGTWDTGFWWGNNDNICETIDFPCLSISADGINNNGLPAITKVRFIDNINGGILAPLEHSRHWNLTEAKTYKGQWKDKLSDCIWRGSPTGIQDSSNFPDTQNKRMICCYKWSDKFDIGITWNVEFNQPTSQFFNSNWNSKYIKQSLTIHELLNYKYILSIPGNDKDTGLNWKLASSSLVLMAPPKIESWLMEGLLIPWIHYVPLLDDYSDLDIIVEWCRNNDKKCQNIIRNANHFMCRFENLKLEKDIFIMIKEYYKTAFTLI